MESELSAKYFSQLDDKNEGFIGRKRNSKNLKENYLFRRVLNGKTLGRYEEMANTYYNMMAFNWDDEKLLKNRASSICKISINNQIVNNLNSSAFWFHICSMYFPFCENEFLTESKWELIPETFNKILERIILNKKNLKKKSYINTKYKFLNDIKSFIEDESILKWKKEDKDGNIKEGEEIKNPNGIDEVNTFNFEDNKTVNRDGHDKSIDFYIDRMENCLTLLNNKNNSMFKSLTNQLQEKEGRFLLLNGKEYNYDPNDVLSDLKYYNIYSKKFQNYLIKKKEDRVYTNTSVTGSGNKSNGCILSRLEEEELNNNPDDIVCVICNDGDYEDDDLIVYCSSCQMTVHQSCYGIVVLPKEDWICHPCTAFGVEKSKLISCVCCPVRGGAMKPSNLKKSSSFHSYINNLKHREENESLTQKIKYKVEKFISIYNNDSEFKNGQKNIPKSFFNTTLDNPKENSVNENFSVVSNSNKDHEDFKLNKNKNNNLIINECKDVNGLDNHFNEILTSNLKKDLSDINSTVLNETESKKTITTVINLNTKKRGRQKKSNKIKNKKKDKKEQETQPKEKTNQDLITNTKAFNDNAWIHLSCALWTPEIVIQEFARKDEIQNIESIDKKRFLEKCNICGLSSQGPTVKCENEKCQLRFHVECARINKYQLEMVNNSSGDNHRPHRLIKNIELRRHRAIDDIEAFQKALEKNYEILSKYDKRNEFTVFVSRKIGGTTDETGAKRQIFENQNKNKVKFLSKKLKAKLLNHIRDLAKRVSNVNVIVKKVKKNPEVYGNKIINGLDNDLTPVAHETNMKEEGKMKVDEINCINDKITEYNYSIKNFKDKINLTYYDTLNPKIFPWYILKGFSNLSPYDLYKIYMTELVPDEYHYAKLILKKNMLTKKKKLSKKKKVREIVARVVVPTVIHALPAEATPSLDTFCYCNKPCNGEFMIACKYGEDGDNKCVHNGWVHQDCVEKLRNLTKEIIEDDNFVFICNECIEKYENN